MEPAPHFHPPWGCIPRCRWLDPTIYWAPQQWLMGALTYLFVSYWNGRMLGEKDGRINDCMGEDLANIRPFCCSLNVAVISAC